MRAGSVQFPALHESGSRYVVLVFRGCTDSGRACFDSFLAVGITNWKSKFLHRSKAREELKLGSSLLLTTGLEGIPQAELNLTVCSESDAATNGAVDDAECAVALSGSAEGLPWLKLITRCTQRVSQDSRRTGKVSPVE
jgi:hypothetical protein